MGDGLRRATLDAMCSRAPWTGMDYERWILTADELRAVIPALGVPDQQYAIGRALESHYGSRKADRALQLLRKAGLIRFDKTSRRWCVVGEDER